MKKQTVITIEFEGEIPEHKLDELLGELSATCSEDSQGRGWTDGRVVTRHRVDTFELEIGQDDDVILVEILKNRTIVEAFEFYVEGSNLVLCNLENEENFQSVKRFHDPAELYKVALRMPIHPDGQDMFIQLLNDYYLKDEFIDEFQSLITLNL